MGKEGGYDGKNNGSRSKAKGEGFTQEGLSIDLDNCLFFKTSETEFELKTRS